MVTLERTPSDASYKKYVTLVALLFFIHLLHVYNACMLRCPLRRTLVGLAPTRARSKVGAAAFSCLFFLLPLHPSIIPRLSSSSLRPLQHFLVTFHYLPAIGASVDLLHFPDDLLFKDGQDRVLFADLFKHHAAVKLVAHFLEIVPGQGDRRRYETKHSCAFTSWLH